MVQSSVKVAQRMHVHLYIKLVEISEEDIVITRSCLEKTYMMARYIELQFIDCLTWNKKNELNIKYFFFYILTDVNSYKICMKWL